MFAQDNGSRYVVRLDLDSTTDATYSVKGNIVSFLANGYRYGVDIKNGTVSRLEFFGMTAYTVDFSTQYSADNLRDSLTTNVKNCIMSEIVQTMIDSRKTVESTV